MSNSYSPAMVDQSIPLIDIDPIEIDILSQVFYDSDVSGPNAEFQTSDGVNDSYTADIVDIQAGLKESPRISPGLRAFIDKALAQAGPAATWTNIDFNDHGDEKVDWRDILQSIVARSTTLNYLTITWVAHSDKMTAGSLGGGVTLITKDHIEHRNLDDALEGMINEANIDLTERELRYPDYTDDAYLDAIDFFLHRDTAPPQLVKGAERLRAIINDPASLTEERRRTNHGMVAGLVIAAKDLAVSRQLGLAIACEEMADRLDVEHAERVRATTRPNLTRKGAYRPNLRRRTT